MLGTGLCVLKILRMKPSCFEWDYRNPSRLDPMNQIHTHIIEYSTNYYGELPPSPVSSCARDSPEDTFSFDLQWLEGGFQEAPPTEYNLGSPFAGQSPVAHNPQVINTPPPNNPQVFGSSTRELQFPIAPRISNALSHTPRRSGPLISTQPTDLQPHGMAIQSSPTCLPSPTSSTSSKRRCDSAEPSPPAPSKRPRIDTSYFKFNTPVVQSTSAAYMRDPYVCQSQHVRSQPRRMAFTTDGKYIVGRDGHMPVSMYLAQLNRMGMQFLHEPRGAAFTLRVRGLPGATFFFHPSFLTLQSLAFQRLYEEWDGRCEMYEVTVPFPETFPGVWEYLFTGDVKKFLNEWFNDPVTLRKTWAVIQCLRILHIPEEIIYRARLEIEAVRLRPG